MTRLAIVTVPILLAACAAPASRVAAPPSPQEQACASQADQDPALKEALGIAAGNLDWEFQHEPEMRQLRQDAITRCLRARGLASRGGVERPR